MEDTTVRIRTLNDSLRVTFLGGRVVMTAGIQSLSDEVRARVFSAVRAFSAFTEDNDPYGEHDCAVVDIDGINVVWKIDYYDQGLSYHSPDASDPAVTTRVMTLMLAEEY